MSKQIDERVVSMEFDNANFKKNANETIGILGKLKSSLNLNGASKELTAVGAAGEKLKTSLNFSGATKGLTEVGTASDSLKSKFSALDVAAVTAIANITNKVVNLAESMANGIFVAPIRTGFSMYEQKLNSIQTIMASTGESLDTVKTALADLNDYSNKTIYSFADMTDSIGKFTNNGLKLNDTTKAIKGICNWAAIAGANTQQCSSAMYNLSQSLASGYLQLIDWKSVEIANMGTKQFRDLLIDTAIQMGKLTQATDENGNAIEHAGTTLEKKTLVNYKTFKDTLQEGWASTEVMMNTFQQYANTDTELGKKALAAAADVKTATQLIDVLKEEVATGWSDTFEMLFGDLDQAKTLWGNVYNFIGGGLDKLTKARNKFVSEVFTSNWARLSKSVTDAGVNIDDFKKALIDAGVKSGVITQQMIDDAGGFEKSLQKGWASTKLIKQAIDNLTGSSVNAEQAAADAQKRFEYFLDIIARTWQGEFGNGEDRVKAFAAAGIDYAKVQGLLNKQYYEGSISLADLDEEQMKAIGLTDEQIKSLKNVSSGLIEVDGDFTRLSGRELVIKTFSNVFGSLKKVLGAVDDAFNQVFNSGRGGSEVIYQLLNVIYKLSEAFKVTDKGASSVNKLFVGIFTVIKAVISIIKHLSGTVLQGLNIMFGLVGDTLAWFGEKLIKVTDYIKDVVKNSQILIKISDGFHRAKDKVMGYVNSFMQLPIVTDFIAKLNDKIAYFKEHSVEIFGVAANKIKGYIKAFSELPIISDVLAFLSKRIDAVKAAFKDFYDKLKTFDGFSFDNVKKAFGTFADSLTSRLPELGKISDVFKKISDAIKDAFSNGNTKAMGSAAKATKSVGDAFSSLGGGVTGVIGKFSKSVSSLIKVLKAFVDVASGKITTLDLGQVLASAFGVSALKTFNNLNKILDAASNFLKGFGDLPDVLNSTIESMTRTFEKLGKAKAKAMKMDALSNLLKSFSMTIAVMVGCYVILSKMSPSEVEQGGIMLGVMVGGLTGFIFAVSRCKLSRVQKASAILWSISGAVGILAIAVKILSGIDTVKAVGACIPVGIIITALTLSLSYLSQNSDKVVKGSHVLFQMANAVLIISVAMKIISTIKTKKSIAIAIEISTFLIVMTGCLVWMSNKGDSCVKGGGALLAMATALLIMSLVIKIVAGFSAKELWTCLGVSGAIILLLISISEVMKIAENSGQYIDKAGLAMIGISVAMLILVKVIKNIAAIKVPDLAKGIIVIALFGLIISKLVVSLGNYSKDTMVKAGGIITAFGLCMIAISLALVILGSIDTTGLVVGVAAISVVTFMMALLINTTRYATDKQMKAAKGLILTLTGCLLALTIAMAIMTMLDPTKMVLATACIAALGGIMALLMKVSSSCGDTSSAIKLLLGVAAVMAIIGIIITIMGALDVSKALVIAASISVLMLSLAGAMWIISKTEYDDKQLVALGFMVGAIAMIGIIVNIMGELPMTNALVIAASISVLMLSLAGAMWIISQTNVQPSQIAALGVMIVAVLVIGNVVSALSKIPIKKGVASALLLTGLLAALTVGLLILGNLDMSGVLANSLILAVSLAAIGGALAIMVAVMAAASGIDNLPSLLIEFSIALLAITAVGYLAEGAAVGLIALGASMTLIGIGALAAGEGMLLFSTGLAALVNLPLPDLIATFGVLLVVMIALIAAAPLLGAAAIPIGLFGLALMALGGGLLLVVAGINAVISLLSSFISGMCTMASSVGDALSNIGNFFVNIFSTIFNVLGNAIGFVANAAVNIASGLWNGIKNGVTGLAEMVGGFISGAVTKIGSFVKAFASKGKSLAKNLWTGMKSSLASLGSKVCDIVRAVPKKIKSLVKDFKDIGVQLIKGLIKGVKSLAGNIAGAVKDGVGGAVKSAKNFLGIHSPSRVFMRIGQYMDMGLINGINSMSDDIANATTNAGKTAVDAMSNTLSCLSDTVTDGIDVQPAIAPVLDLSNVDAGMSTLDDMFTRKQMLNVGTAMEASKNQNGNQNGIDNSANNGTTVQFTQNNYSPKALSRIEIYRQTKNQLSTIGRMATN